MVTSLIFDLDNTLVDTSLALSARSRRAWQEVYSLIPRFSLYDGMLELCDLIRSQNYNTCIVSTSPKRYVEKVVRYFDLPFMNIIGYHDARIKPAPDALYLALRTMGAHPLETISFGDRSIDMIASNTAGIPSAACFWGSDETESLLGTPSTYRFFTPEDVYQFLSTQLKIYQ